MCTSPVFATFERRRDDARFTGRRRLPESRPHLALGAASQRGAIHVRGTARHGGSRVDVLGNRVLEVPLWNDNLHVARVDLLLRDHAEHTTEVVDMVMSVDHRDDRAIATVLAVERERCCAGLAREQRIDDDHAVVGLEE